MPPGKENTMYEIIANPEDYQIDDLINGTGNAPMEFSQDERQKWAAEIDEFSEKLIGFSEKSKELSKVLSSATTIATTPASLKTLKIQLFNINDALNNALDIAGKLESDIISK